ncbi:MAG TPA: hypothetical protein VII72_14385 [Myxococcota bacterium]
MQASSIDADALRVALSPDGWLGHQTPERFLELAGTPVEIPENERTRFFARRGLRGGSAKGDARRVARDLIDLDLCGIAHAASFLVSGAAEQTSRALLPPALAPALQSDLPQLDHVGLEVFGELDWYLRVLADWSKTGAFELRGYRIFPSVQVRKVLAYDPQLADVRIARVYLEGPARTLNLEIFEVTQHWLYTAARQRATFAAEDPREGGPLVPVGHLALAVESWKTVEAVHCGLAEARLREEISTPYGDEISYNPGDASINTKFRARGGPIIELVSYGHGIETELEAEAQHG